MEKEIKIKIEQGIKNGLFSACCIGVVKADGERNIVYFGGFDLNEKKIVINEDTIFDVASITKVIPTSALALKLIDEGRLKLEDKVINYLPEFKSPDREKVLVKHLLTQTLDFNLKLSDMKDKSPDYILDQILGVSFKTEPGSTFYYANSSSILLGLVVEKVLGMALEEAAAKYFFEPLNMTRTAFHPLHKFSKEEIVPTEIQEWRGGLVHGEVHDESAYILQKEKIVGSAGLFSTVPDILNFLQMILNKGEANNTNLFSAKIIEDMHTNQVVEIGACTGLGWELNQPRYMGKYCDKNTFGKTGFTGCSMVCDLSRGIAFVILSNYTYPNRKPDSNKINEFRREIADMVLK